MVYISVLLEEFGFSPHKELKVRKAVPGPGAGLGFWAWPCINLNLPPTPTVRCRWRRPSIRWKPAGHWEQLLIIWCPCRDTDAFIVKNLTMQTS